MLHKTFSFSTTLICRYTVGNVGTVLYYSQLIE